MEKRFGDVAEFINGRAFKPEDWGTNGLPIIRIQNLTGTNEVFNYYEGEFDKRYLVKNDDILISWSASLGVYRWDKQDAVLNQHIFKVNLKNGIDKTYFYYAVQEKLVEMGRQVHGSTMKHITKGKFDNLKISVPDLKTQQKIAGILEQADAARQKRKQANQLTEAFLQSAFLEMFGDPVRNEKGWEVKKMGDVINSIRYGTGSPPEYQKDGIPFIRATNIKKGRIAKKDMAFISEKESQTIAKCKIKEGDLLVVRSGVNTGDVALIPKEYDGAFAGYDLIVEIEKPFGNFYNHLINSDYGKLIIEPLSRRAGQPHLNADQIKNLEFYFPPLPLQKKFASLVEQVEQLRVKQRESERELENLFQSLMQRYFG